MIDWISMRLTGFTMVIAGIFTIRDQSEILFWVGLLVGVTTIIYNVLNILKKVNRK